MKKLIVILFVFCFSVGVFAQKTILKDPVLERSYYSFQNRGYLLIVNSNDEIWKSETRYEDIVDLQKTVKDMEKQNTEKERQLKELQEKNRKLEDSIKQLTRDLDDLKRKIK
jgi:peptidoglycan hydrolase CwlO-like protein